MDKRQVADRRASERLNLYLPVEVRPLEGEDSGPARGWTVNVSRGGAYFLSSRDWGRGDRCEITILRWPIGGKVFFSPIFRAGAEVLRVDNPADAQLCSADWKAVAVKFDTPFSLVAAQAHDRRQIT